MARYECSVCGYVYDESKEDTPWADLPHDWTCPVCAAAKAQFELVSGGPTQSTVTEADTEVGTGGAGGGTADQSRHPGTSRVWIYLPGHLCRAYGANGPATVDIPD